MREGGGSGWGATSRPESPTLTARRTASAVRGGLCGGKEAVGEVGGGGKATAVGRKAEFRGFEEVCGGEGEVRTSESTDNQRRGSGLSLVSFAQALGTTMHSGGRGASSLSGNGGTATLAEVESMKVTELRAQLQDAGLSTDGKKTDLVGRLMGHIASRQRSPSASPSPRHKRKRPLEEPDAGLVNEVRMYMKANKLSQVMVGQEARVSQAVISQWLSLKYHGHNAKVDTAMREWLTNRRSGRVCLPNPDEPTSVLRPSRSTTFAEKRSKEKRRKDMMMMASADSTSLGPDGLCQLLQLREAAAAAEANYNADDSAPGSDDQEDDYIYDGSESERTSDAPHIDRRATQPPERCGLLPKIEVGEDVFGLAELAAQTMCELESSPAKPRRSSLRSPDPDEDPRRDEIPAALKKPSAAGSGLRPPNSTGLTWDRVYSYSIGLETSEMVTAPRGVGIRLDYIREAYMLDLNYWPSDAAAQQVSADPKEVDGGANGTSTVLGNQLLSYADFAAFSLLAANPENQTTLPAGYVMSEAKQRSQEAAHHADESNDHATAAALVGTYSSELGPSAIAADTAPKPATAGGDGSDDTTRRHSPPIRWVLLVSPPADSAESKPPDQRTHQRCFVCASFD